MAALSSFAFSVLSIEQAMERDFRRHGHGVDNNSPSAFGRHHRSTRRVTSNHNAFQTVCSPDFEDPPCYATASRQRPAATQLHERDRLPDYDCTVSTEIRVLLNLESINPLHSIEKSDWREVHLEICGTMVNVFRHKDGVKSKLLRSYTLQHAEVGLAPDATYTVYQPNTRLAHLIPSSARPKAFKKDPRLFEARKQHILRLRIETDQILLAHHSKDAIHDLLHTLSAAIDIAQPIDDRSITKQCTIPRRQRRRGDRANIPTSPGDLTNPAFIAEQERILRDMYPSLLAGNDVSSANDDTGNRQGSDQPQDDPQVVDEDEIDVSAMREERIPPSAGENARAPLSRASSSLTQEPGISLDYGHASNPADFDESGKWTPRQTRTQAQVTRYVQRCMPVLLAEAVRASDVLIFNGRRVKINWRMDTLDDWELQPPSYKSHHFKRAAHVSLERRPSSASTVEEHQASDSQGSSDEITPLDSTTSNLELSKMVSAIGSVNKLRSQAQTREALRKVNSSDVNSVSTLSGVVYCF